MILRGRGEASSKVKNMLKRMGFDSDTIRRVAIAMYEGEINMVISGGGGNAFVSIYADRVEISLVDHGPGIADVDKAMQEGYSTAPDNVRAFSFRRGHGSAKYKKIRRCASGGIRNWRRYDLKDDDFGRGQINFV